MDFFGWWLEQQLPTARASFSAEKIRLSECGTVHMRSAQGGGKRVHESAYIYCFSLNMTQYT